MKSEQAGEQLGRAEESLREAKDDCMRARAASNAIASGFGTRQGPLVRKVRDMAKTAAVAPEEHGVAGLSHADRSAARPPEGPAAAIDDGHVAPRAVPPHDAPEAPSDANPIASSMALFKIPRGPRSSRARGQRTSRRSWWMIRERAHPFAK